MVYLPLLKISIFGFLWTSTSCVEEPHPSIFLSPRNFNHHPYEVGPDPNKINTDTIGPVVFPPSRPDETREQSPIDNHPYSQVAYKRKLQHPSRFLLFQNKDINPRVYEALSNHAVKVLSEPASQLRKDYTLSSLPNGKHTKYTFSYNVVDRYSHSQSQNSRGATNGEYRVKLPDGRVQIVSYIADKNGYKADVKYTRNDFSTQNIQIQPFFRGEEANYPTSLHFSAPSVEIYTSGVEKINGLGNYVGSAAAPYLFQKAAGYEEDVVASRY